MHIGNVYAALAAWLSARSAGGRLLLRIEDIDTPRVRPDADRWIMDDLTWLGLDWDGEPVYQSQRGESYDQALAVLRERGLLYPCFCSRAEIRAASAPQEGDGYVIYPGTCSRLDDSEREARLIEGRRHLWRVRVPDAIVGFDDVIFGKRDYDLARRIGDTVLRRSDGLYSYQLAVTVDDLAMGVNDVVRGRDLLRSTALQLWIRSVVTPEDADKTHNSGDILRRNEGFGAVRFTHLPLIDDPHGRRLAKRDRALDLGALREEGVSAETIIGYCAWLLSLVPEPGPVAPTDLLEGFSWDALRADHADRVCDPDLLR
ncbi:tRNA glutamyl-Q(34) synthetase GluQRS [Bifidobacterium catulorum]|uniref:tRNA glutamyl-Q(34) synthetase GluQRS n=2 Tax=Bifidobacterium catulorum TaxID=1630173 RepID=A0A2U2MQ45_9BIFI|nr:tRNA glutamyl-Q(34) synthetase GluQRS [Bifidobacterium catulorum]